MNYIVSKQSISLDIYGFSSFLTKINFFKKRIHETNLLNTVGIRESGSTGFVWIRKSIVLRICEDW